MPDVAIALSGGVDFPGKTCVREILLAESVWRPGGGVHRVAAQVRYRAEPIEVTVSAVEGQDRLKLSFDDPVSVGAPGQSVVLYRGERVVGGGIITH
jgi:tRNA U34 2-thiouridine synthase MnmA/TrmU